MGILNAPPRGVTVRMYRQGLGDCFLLAFPTDDPAHSFYMLIDCGVITGHKSTAPDGTPRGPSLSQVAADIRDSTGGRIDALVLTHEHWDHVGAFHPSQALDLFKQMAIERVWLAWTEDPNDAQAAQLKEQIKQTRLSLAAALQAAANPEAVQAIQNVMLFFGATGSGDTAEAMQAGSALGKQPPNYLDPEKNTAPLALPGVSGARVYVLAPPRDPAKLKRVNPRQGEAYPATPQAHSGPSLAQAFLLAARRDLSAATVEEKELRNATLPFADQLCIPWDQARSDPFFRAHYFEADGQDWRRIDDDWLGAGEQLAIALDNYTNNTSLVLAIELVPSGKVLLFPGDAQVGSWLSWGDRAWTVVDGDAAREVKVADLLARTVLYKVGHHGSSNASLKDFVDQMTRPDLVGMVPVNHDDALAMRWNDMPWPPLLAHLSETDAQGNAIRGVIRMDVEPAPRPVGVDEKQWAAAVEETELYVQYVVDAG